MSNRKPTLATLRLSGCSRCTHFSSDVQPKFRDLSRKIDLVYSPLLGKQFPELVDITLVEGAIANRSDLMRVKKARPHTNVLISVGDCSLAPPTLLKRVQARDTLSSAIERALLPLVPVPGPELAAVLSAPIDRVRAVNEIVPVDILIAGCPPDPEEIYRILSDLIDRH